MDCKNKKNGILLKDFVMSEIHPGNWRRYAVNEEEISLDDYKETPNCIIEVYNVSETIPVSVHLESLAQSCIANVSKKLYDGLQYLRASAYVRCSDENIEKEGFDIAVDNVAEGLRHTFTHFDRTAFLKSIYGENYATSSGEEGCEQEGT